jgi:hypothetical protein
VQEKPVSSRGETPHYSSKESFSNFTAMVTTKYEVGVDITSDIN